MAISKRDFHDKQRGMNYVLLSIAALSIPFVNLGVSFYISFQIFGVVILSILILKMGVQRRALSYCYMASIFFLVKLLVEIRTGSIQELLLVCREMLLYFIFLLAVAQVSYLPKVSVLINIYKTLIVLFTIILASQFIAIKNGVFLQFPYEWYVFNQGTLDGVGLALETESRIRPVGFYGEPSYMAFIVISALVLYLAIENRFRVAIFTILLNLMCLLLLGGLSGVLSFIILLAVWGYQNISLGNGRSRMRRYFVMSVFTVLSMVSILTQSDFLARLSSILSKDDMDLSIYGRFIAPVLMIINMVNEGRFFGYPVSEILRIGEFHGVGSIDNAFFFLLLHYGLLAPFLLLILFKYVKYRLLIVYAILILNFNGAYFSFDKIITMSLVIGLSFGVYRGRYSFSSGGNAVKL